MWLIGLLFIQGFAARSEVISGSTEFSPTGNSYAQKLCLENYKKNNCEEFFRQNPGRAKDPVDCSHPANPSAVLAACGSGSWEAAKDTFSSLVNLPIALWSVGNTPEREAQVRFYQTCVRSLECKLALWSEVHGGSPDPATEKRLEELDRWQGLEAGLHSGKMLKQAAVNEQVRKILAEETDVAVRNAKIEKLIPGWTLRQSGHSRSLYEAGAAAANHLFKNIQCQSWATQTEAVCYGLVTILAPGAALKVASKFPRLASLRLSSVSSRTAVPGLQAAEWEKVRKLASVEQMNAIERALVQVRLGQTVAVADAEVAADVFQKAGVSGLFAFHRTTPQGLQAIADSGQMIGRGVQGSRIYAFPANPGASASKAAGKAVGDEVVIFQGQAAALFEELPLRGAMSAIGRYHNHRVTPVGRLVIDEAESVGGTLVVKRAHMVTSATDQLTLVRARVLDVGTVASPSGSLGFVTYYTFARPVE
jgi:hypothetical protein